MRNPVRSRKSLLLRLARSPLPPGDPAGGGGPGKGEVGGGQGREEERGGEERRKGRKKDRQQY